MTLHDVNWDSKGHSWEVSKITSPYLFRNTKIKYQEMFRKFWKLPLLIFSKSGDQRSGRKQLGERMKMIHVLNKIQILKISNKTIFGPKLCRYFSFHSGQLQPEASELQTCCIPAFSIFSSSRLNVMHSFASVASSKTWFSLVEGFALTPAPGRKVRVAICLGSAAWWRGEGPVELTAWLTASGALSWALCRQAWAAVPRLTNGFFRWNVAEPVFKTWAPFSVKHLWSSLVLGRGRGAMPGAVLRAPRCPEAVPQARVVGLEAPASLRR